MPHEHSDECRKLHEMISSLTGREGLTPAYAIDNGMGVDPSPTASGPHVLGLDGVNLDLEIETARRALEAMGCEG